MFEKARSLNPEINLENPKEPITPGAAKKQSPQTIATAIYTDEKLKQASNFLRISITRSDEIQKKQAKIAFDFVQTALILNPQLDIRGFTQFARQQAQAFAKEGMPETAKTINEELDKILEIVND